MPISAPVKTWQDNLNQAFATTATQLTDNQQLLRGVKDSMIGFATLPWAVIASSNAVVANAADNWTVNGDLVWATPPTAHSWIQLRQTGIGATFEVLLVLETASVGGAFGPAVYFSLVGFTGGTTTARPTAADEVLAKAANISWLGQSGVAAFSSYLHVMQSTDGQCTRVTIYADWNTPGKVAAFWLFDVPDLPRPSFTTPHVVIVDQQDIGSATSAMSYSRLLDTDTVTFGRTAAGSFTAFLSCKGLISTPIGQHATYNVANDFSGEYVANRIGVVSDTPGNRGKKGELFDLWWGSRLHVTGDDYPSGGTRAYTKHTDIIQRWDGSVMSFY